MKHFVLLTTQWLRFIGASLEVSSKWWPELWGGQAYYPALAGELITPQVGQVGPDDAGHRDCAPAAC